MELTTNNDMGDKIYIATYKEDGEEPYLLKSNECKAKEHCGDSDWWFDIIFMMFRRFYSYHHELYGNQYIHEEVSAILFTP